MWSTLYEGFTSAVTKFLSVVLSLLPKSPFAATIAAWEPPQYLGWLNWIMPVGQILTITALWLSAVAAYYLISILARWVKVIGE